ncbi:MAG: HAMP domain-containing sensor histidine kinase [Pseudomonadota bacterium]
MSGSLTSRTIAAGLIWITISLGAGGWVILMVFQGSISRQFDAGLVAELELLTASVAELEGDPSVRMTNPDFWRVYSGTYWQASALDGRSYRSRSLWDAEFQIETASPGEVRANILGPDEQPVRLLARAIDLPDGQSWTVAVAQDTSSLKGEIARFERTLWISAAFVCVALLAFAFVLLRITLAPLKQLRYAVQNRSVISQPIFGSYPREVAPLVNDLNALLARNERLREKGRLQAANLAHALKTPAAILTNELAKARRGETIDTVLSGQAVESISAAADRHLSLVNAMPPDPALPSQTDLLSVTRSVVRAIGRIYPHIRWEIVGNNSVHVGVAKTEVTEILGNVLDNAGKWARSKVRVALTEDTDFGTIVVDDDGPGVPQKDRGRILKQGMRLDESRSGSGLGLTIVKDIVEVHRGALHMGRAPSGGLRIRIRLPAAPMSALPKPKSGNKP